MVGHVLYNLVRLITAFPARNCNKGTVMLGESQLQHSLASLEVLCLQPVQAKKLCGCYTE